MTECWLKGIATSIEGACLHVWLSFGASVAQFRLVSLHQAEVWSLRSNKCLVEVLKR